MLVRLLPNQIAEVWNIIRQDVLDLLPSVVDKSNGVAVSIVSKMMEDKINLWIFYPDGAVNTVSGFLVTAIVIDGITNQRNLVVYAAKVYEPTKHSLQLQILNGLKIFAASMGCTSVFALTKFGALGDIAERLGGIVDSVIVFPVKEINNAK